MRQWKNFRKAAYIINEVLRVRSSCFQAIMQYPPPVELPSSWLTNSMGRSGVVFEVEGEAGMAGLEAKRVKKMSMSVS